MVKTAVAGKKPNKTAVRAAVRPPGKKAVELAGSRPVVDLAAKLPKQSRKAPVKSLVAVTAPKLAKVVKAAAEPNRVSSLLLQATLAAAREEYGDDQIAAAGDASSLSIGIRVPFAMSYVLQNNIWPLGRIMELVGMEKSNKSGLAFEVCRWFDLHGGLTQLLENETKYSEDLAQSIFGYSDELGREILGHIPCESLEDWQGKLTYMVSSLKQSMLKGVTQMVKGKPKLVAKPMGRTVPVCLILDSLAGGIAEENIKKIDTRGFAGRNHPAEALANTQFFKKFRSDLVKWPFSLVVVNHLRKQKAEKGPHIERRTPGGKHMGFQETFQLELSKVKSLEFVDTRPGAVALNVNGNRVKIQCRKSSMGDEMREVMVDFMWWHDRHPSGRGVRQYSKWQWSAATIDLLQSQEGGAAGRIREVVDLHKAKDNRFWSTTLGVSREAPIPKADIGDLLEQNEKVVEQLSDLFAIKQRIVMQRGDDYRKLIDTNTRSLRKRMEK